MKKLILLFGIIAAGMLLLCTCATTPTGPDDLDLAIRDASDYLNENIPKGSKVAILNIQSDYNDLSEYIIEELIANAVNDKSFTVVDRAQLETIRMELKFQVSGEVSDASALEIGKFLGAQTIVTGAISELADRHRLRIRALDVKTTQVQGQYNRNVNTSKTLTALMKGGRSSMASYGTSSQRNNRAADNTADASGRTSQSTTAARQTTQTYKIGDKGPAGGLIFYDKGNSIGGWRYLEASPVAVGPSVYISNPGAFPKDLYQLWERTYDSTGRAIGRGIVNSENLMVIAQSVGGFNWAVRLCDNYELNVLNDWFLPSRDELNFIYGNLYLKGLGNYRQEQYWSSTGWTDTWGSYRAWYIDFTDGKQDNVNAGQQRRVIPVRQF